MSLSIYVEVPIDLVWIDVAQVIQRALFEDHGLPAGAGADPTLMEEERGKTTDRPVEINCGEIML